VPPSRLHIKKDNFGKVKKAIRELSTNRIMVGVPAAKALRRPEEGEKSTINNAAIAYLMENGCPAVNIPPRPFLKPTIEASRVLIVERMKGAAIYALKGNSIAVLQALHSLGLAVSTAVKLKINTGPFKGLSERTLQRRRARGRFGTKPLIDTTQLRSSITYVLKRVRTFH